MRNLIYLVLIGLIVLGCAKGDSADPMPVTPPPILEIGEMNLEIPENNKDCETGTITLDKAEVEFKWKAAPNATKYELQVTDIQDAKATKFPDIVGTKKTISLSRGKSYSWAITAANTGTKTVTSAQWKFYLSGEGKPNRAPNAAKAISPVPGSTISANAAGNVKFDWLAQDPDSDVLSYTIRIDTLSASTQKYAGNSFDTKNPFYELKLQPGKIYYWSVVVKDQSIAVKSDVFTFKLK